MGTVTLFSQPAYIEVQGQGVLTFHDLTEECSIYHVAGLVSPKVIIYDYRAKINEELRSCLIKGDVSRFAYSFSQPAHVNLIEQDGSFVLEFYDTEIKTPRKMIWIVAGLSEEQFSDYPYEFSLAQHSGTNRTLSALAIYSLSVEESSLFSESLALEVS